MSSTNDADFYHLVHQLLLIREFNRAPDERRREIRHTYKRRQLISPCSSDSDLPDHTSFYPVECHDISPGGMSFHSVERPDYERLIIALGQAPFTFIEAKVVHVSECDADRPENFVVGCRFDRRVGC